ncbi:MAG TPA: bis(5'-nucleosyl)-tetraphosphatase (symmetrical) YqeK [Methylomusa anaerophila]|uniref:bis(5'-nucleosyl)-tetraphosphatase (symmetrical) n=1 Tax=Methylomusa anaerophila TaxID=1930071 RepID=A0A348AF86_9FIRM|nr:bis(5'-nucleosyl)-tetraphosphatase (symmetrical) YqeK [Methylomusa anaerophila]BBB89734.1 putative nicotinate-nucleotide adenylyltransferase [Methylomusa anaerophila]HML89220.1 bis(5'-nucleosyl)-tetraphosphatase (symmetrical) YqeK [Methylomusa anaerophila]
MILQKNTEKLAAKLSPKRFQHSLRVSETAAILAKRFDADEEKARVAGLLHDCARDITDKQLLQLAKDFAIVTTDVDIYHPTLLHAPVASYLAQTEYNTDDPEILRAISLHTTGGPSMNVLDKIIYLADFIEPGRNFPGVDKLRSLAAADLDTAVLAAFDQSLQYIIAQGNLIHPATIEGRNWLIRQLL